MKALIDKIEQMLLEYSSVALSKECKTETITYRFFLDDCKQTVVRKEKQHYKDGVPGDVKTTKVDIPIRKFLYNDIYHLVSQGYNMERNIL